MWSIVFTLWVLVVETSSTEFDATTNSDSPKEYCQIETFSPRCWKNEIILVQHAIYGRMHSTGRCLQGEDAKFMEANRDDPQYLGCSADVLAILNHRCSGKNQCDIRLPDSELTNTKPCYANLVMYLEAKYSCIGVVDDDRTCTLSATSIPQHILGSTPSSLGCGRKIQPWVMEAPAGQRINITLIEFNQLVLKGSVNHKCEQYGYILEKSHKKNVSICSNLGRESNVYLSIANIVEIVLTVDQETEPEVGDGDQQKFIIRFEAIGCSDLVPPEDAWLKRSTDEAIVGCYSSRQTWQLRCNGHQWIGVLGNCSHASIHEALSSETTQSDYQVVGILAICGVGLAVCLTIVCMGVLCVKGLNSANKSNHSRRLSKSPDYVVTGNQNTRITSTTLNKCSTMNQTYAVYAGSDNNQFNGNYNRDTSNGTHGQYFVLDPEAVSREQLLLG